MSKSFKTTTILLMLVIVLSKVTGFLREIFLSYFYGVSSIADAYLIALTVPGVIFAFVSTALSVGFVPVYSKILKSNEDPNNFVNNLSNCMFLVSTIMIFLIFVFAPQIIDIIAPGFFGETRDLAIEFTRIFVFGIYFSGLISIYTGYLQVHNSYIVAAFAGIPFNVIVLISIWASYKYDLYWLIIGTLVAKLAEIIYFMPYLRKSGYKYSFYLNTKDESIRNIVALSIPLIFSISVNQINIIVDKSLASKITSGGIAAISYAQHLNQLVIGVFVLSVSTIYFTKFSRLYVENKHTDLRISLIKSGNLIAFFVIPSSIIFIVFSKYIVGIVYGRGSFNASAIDLTAETLIYFSIGMIGFAYREILSRFYYAMHDTKTPVYNAFFCVIINIFLSVVLSKYMGISGLALATSIAAIITSMLLFYNLRNKVKDWKNDQIILDFIKILFSSILAAAVSYPLFYWLIGLMNDLFSMLIMLFVYGILYLVFLSFFRIDGVADFLKGFKSKVLKPNDKGVK